MALLSLEGIGKRYMSAAGEHWALREVQLEVDEGEFLAIMGPSGSGKSTLMNILGCLDTPSTGDYFLAGRNVAHLSSAELAKMRNRFLGFVFQGFNLLKRIPVEDNVALPLVYSGIRKKERLERAKALLSRVGLAGMEKRIPNQLSGGQQQRVAIARALVNQPRLLLADEPTGNLDTATAEDILELFLRLNEETGVTVVLVTHDAEVASHARRMVRVRDGRVQEERLEKIPA